MAKFKKDGNKETPAISTASLTDIVFMLLFFFMVSTTMREVELKIKVKVPGASEVQKLEKKSLASNIYIGEPLKIYQKSMGTEPLIQLNDQFATKEKIMDYIAQEREARPEEKRGFMITNLKIDKDCKMGIVTDVKQELRKCNALRIYYCAKKAKK